jgi:hypothetical protein
VRVEPHWEKDVVFVEVVDNFVDVVVLDVVEVDIEIEVETEMQYFGNEIVSCFEFLYEHNWHLEYQML